MVGNGPDDELFEQLCMTGNTVIISPVSPSDLKICNVPRVAMVRTGIRGRNKN